MESGGSYIFFYLEDFGFLNGKVKIGLQKIATHYNNNLYTILYTFFIYVDKGYIEFPISSILFSCKSCENKFDLQMHEGCSSSYCRRRIQSKAIARDKRIFLKSMHFIF